MFILDPYIIGGFTPLEFSPFVYYDTLDKPAGLTVSFPDETGDYTATGNLNLTDIGGERYADFVSSQCWDADDPFASRINGEHTIVMVIDADASIPSGFECLTGAFVGSGGSEHQHSLFQISGTGRLRAYLKIGLNTAIGDTSTQALTAGQKSVVIVRIHPTNDIRIRINGVNRIMEATNDGDMSAITLASLALTKNHFWGCRNADGTAGSFHNGNHGALIGYASTLTDAQCTEIEDYYA